MRVHKVAAFAFPPLNSSLMPDTTETPSRAPLSPQKTISAFANESELPRWLWTKSKVWARRFFLAVRGPDYRVLTQFSHDFGTCLRTSSDVARGLELCVRPIRRTPIGRAWIDSANEIRRGQTLTESLRPAKESLPAFYLPVVSAGEESGRLVEAFEYLERHCRLLTGPATTLRNLWVYPLAILLAGSVFRILLLAGSGSILDAISLFFSELFGWLQLALILGIVLLSPARYFLDRIRLSIPWIGELEREIAIHRFFRIMSLVYSVSGHRVEEMIRTSAATVGNRAARIDLQKAATAIEKQSTISEAFRRVPLLNSQEKSAIETAELSGTLEQCFEHLSDTAAHSVVAKINFIQPILVRIVMALVVFSLVTTLLRLVV